MKLNIDSREVIERTDTTVTSTDERFSNLYYKKEHTVHPKLLDKTTELLLVEDDSSLKQMNFVLMWLRVMLINSYSYV